MLSDIITRRRPAPSNSRSQATAAIADKSPAAITGQWTSVPNRVLEGLFRAKIGEHERAVFDFILRKTFGYQKPHGDWIAISQFVKALALDRRLVHRALVGLKRKRLIVISGDDRRKKIYRIEADPGRWKVSSRQMRTVIRGDDALSSGETTALSSPEPPTKENPKIKLTKEIPPVAPLSDQPQNLTHKGSRSGMTAEQIEARKAELRRQAVEITARNDAKASYSDPVTSRQTDRAESL